MKFFKFTAILFLLQGCSSNYEWGWYILSPDNVEGLTNIKFLISGITTTIGDKQVSLGVTFSGGVSDPEINKNTGDVIYIDNRSLVTRDSRQKEDVKIILEF